MFRGSISLCYPGDAEQMVCGSILSPAVGMTCFDRTSYRAREIAMKCELYSRLHAEAFREGMVSPRLLTKTMHLNFHWNALIEGTIETFLRNLFARFCDSVFVCKKRFAVLSSELSKGCPTQAGRRTDRALFYHKSCHRHDVQLIYRKSPFVTSLL